MAVGRYVTIDGQKQRFFGMITNVILSVTDPMLMITPPDASEGFLSQVLSGTSAYGTLHILPMLTIGGGEEGAQAVKTVPSHFSQVYLATQADIEIVFGMEDARQFHIGTPLDMETKICLNLPELVKRSNGIFGKSGTGKTFLTRLLLIGMLQKSAAVNLVFDMHSEYGWRGTAEGGRGKVKALKQLFPSYVAVFALDEESSRRRKVNTDFIAKIGYDEIEPEDIALLKQTLNLTEPSIEAVYQLKRKFGKNWLKATMDLDDSEESSELLRQLNIHESTYQNLRRGLNTIRRLPFIEAHAAENAVDTILAYLEKGIHVVLEFGRYTDITAYILVANLLTRRIYARYRDYTERAIGEDTAKPRPLVITIEEAHKFLNPEVVERTIFGTIAREMRKYNVTLLVIDQRPSRIDEEVMSQLGTKISCLLDNERDIDSVLSGVSGKSELKSVLAKLESKQQALIFGHAVPMPVVIKTREYGSPESYKSLSTASGAAAEPTDEDIEELFN
jgi:DNA helicase HerA-like ATPase